MKKCLIIIALLCIPALAFVWGLGLLGGGGTPPVACNPATDEVGKMTSDGIRTAIGGGSSYCFLATADCSSDVHEAFVAIFGHEPEDCITTPIMCLDYDEEMRSVSEQGVWTEGGDQGTWERNAPCDGDGDGVVEWGE